MHVRADHQPAERRRSSSFDAIEKRPVVIDDAIAIRSMVYISMSWDHRVIDGELATRFLARVKQNLETWDFAEDLGLWSRDAAPAWLIEPAGPVPYGAGERRDAPARRAPARRGDPRHR